MLLPKKVKFRKWQTSRSKKNRTRRIETRGTTVAFGSFGLKALTQARVKSTQIEAARKAMSREIKKTGRLWIRIFPDRPYTAKPAEVGMGKGKGDPQGYVFEVLPGRMIFEIDGVDAVTSKMILEKGGAKLPLVARVVARS